MPEDFKRTLKTPLLVAGDNLVLRPAELDDAESYLQLVAENYERLSKWHSAPRPSDLMDERRKYMAEDLRKGENGRAHWWLIESAGDLAGTIALHSIQARDRTAFVGYWLAADFTGRGIMTGSLRTAIDWAFSELRLARVEIQCAVENPVSCAVPERLGIRRESIRRQSQIRNGVTYDMANYVALADNWPPEPPERPLPARTIAIDDESRLRQFAKSDRDAMWKALDAGRDYLGKYLPWMAEFKTEEDHNRGFDKRRNERDFFDGSGSYIVEYRGELAGTVGFPAPNRDNGTEVGYWLRQDLQGRGIMTRSVEAVITMLFVEMGLHRVTIRAATTNLPSRGIPERLGFRHEGTMRGASCVKGEYFDLDVYSILDHEWLARSKNA